MTVKRWFTSERMIPAKLLRTLVILSGAILMTISLAGCHQNSYTSTVDQNPKKLEMPIGDYHDVAWMSSSLLASVYAPTANADRWLYQVIVYNIDTDIQQQVNLLPLEECISSWSLVIDVLPSGALGIVNQCNFHQDRIINRYSRLISWHPDSEVTTVLQQLPIGKDVWTFSFLPDMSEGIIGFDSSGGIVGELVQINASGEIQDFVPQFGRARDGSYTPDGSQIAFFASERVPEYEDSPLGGRPALEYQLSAPWNLYLADSDGANIQELLPDVRYPWQVKWSPQGRYLAFGGVISGKRGIWVYDTVEAVLYLVWEQRTHFDWSPDGTQMVVVEAPPQNNGPGFVPEQLLIIDVELNQQ